MLLIVGAGQRCRTARRLIDGHAKGPIKRDLVMGARVQRWKATARRHPVLAVLLGAYLALSAVEFVRILVHDRPREYDAGFYAWETTPLLEGGRRFHWTRGDTGYVLRPLWAPAVRVSLYLSHPDPPPGGTTVRLSLQDVVFHEETLHDNGWKRLDFYLPPILGHDPWSQSPEEMDIAGVAELREMAGEGPFREAVWSLAPVPDPIRVFTAWRSPPGPPGVWLKIEVNSAFVPADHAETSDRRELGVGVGELLWAPELPSEGLNFHRWEREGDLDFRWSSAARASAPERLPEAMAGVAAATAEFFVRTAARDASARPVLARVWWNAVLAATVRLADNEWHRVEVVVEESSAGGVLTFGVDRTWNPMRDGGGADDRRLGLAVSRPIWRR